VNTGWTAFHRETFIVTRQGRNAASLPSRSKVGLPVHFARCPASGGSDFDRTLDSLRQGTERPVSRQEKEAGIDWGDECRHRGGRLAIPVIEPEWPASIQTSWSAISPRMIPP